MAIPKRFLAIALPASAVIGFGGYGVYRANRPEYTVSRGVYNSEAECKASVPPEYHDQCEPVSNHRSSGHAYYGRYYGPAYYGRSPWGGTSTYDDVGTTSQTLADGTPVKSGSYTKGSKSGGAKAGKSGFGSTGKSTSGGKAG